MYTPLAVKPLKTGEPLEIGVVFAPDEAYAPLIKPLLGHKPGSFRWHIDASFEPGRIQGLETRYYVGCLDRRPICNIMTVEYGGMGILGHVFTVPEHRRKGACHLVMAEQMEDFRRRGGKLLTLGTGYDSAPYWIYHAFGFRSIIPGSGFMKCVTDENFESRLLASGGTTVRPPEWRDWPVVNVLCAQTDGAYVRSVGFGLYGPYNFEGGFLTLMQGMEEQPDWDGRLLISRTGAVVGYATLQPDARWRGNVALLDLFVLPRFTTHTHVLLQALPLPAKKVQCYAEEDADWKVAALLEAGFAVEATLRAQMTPDGRPLDVVVYARMV